MMKNNNRVNFCVISNIRDDIPHICIHTPHTSICICTYKNPIKAENTQVIKRRVKLLPSTLNERVREGTQTYNRNREKDMETIWVRERETEGKERVNE